jgi:hypothetical protein
VGELDRSMTLRELAGWRRYAAERPLPDQLLDLHLARLAAMIVNAMRSPETPPAETADFVILRPRQAAPEAEPGLTEAERMKRGLLTGG